MTSATSLRDARVGDIVRLERHRARRLDATAVVLPGSARPDPYLASLDERADDFAAWDGHVIVDEADAESQPVHRLLILDRYGQVYSVTDTAEAADLPDADALEDWFRFLATACPECGVLDDPTVQGPTL